MGYPTKIKRGKGLESSSSDESLISLKAPESEIVWKTHEYCTQEAPEKGICCFPKKHITTPLTDRVTWKKNTKHVILFLLGIPAVKIAEVDRIVDRLKQEGLKTTTVAERILEAASLYKKKSKYKFLQNFTYVYDAETFLQNLNILKKKQQILLKKIIGGDKVIQIIQDLNDDKKLSKIVNKILNLPSEIKKRKKSIEERKIKVTKGPKKGVKQDKKLISKTDVETDLYKYEKIDGKVTVVYERDNIKDYYKKTIPNLSITQIKMSFRAFFSKNVFGRNNFFHINGEDITLPYLLRIHTSENTEKILLLDLAKISKRSDFKIDDSITAFLNKLSKKSETESDINLSASDLINLTTIISSSKDEDIQISDILKPFDDIESEQDVFYIWLRDKIVEKFRLDEGKVEDKNLVDFILSSFSISMFGAAHSTLSEKFSSVFEIVPDKPRWKYNPKINTKFHISLNKSNIVIRQTKNYPLTLLSSDDKQLELVLGNMDVIYHIKATKKCKFLSAKILLKNIEFTKDADLFTQVDVLRKMDRKKTSKSSKKEIKS